MTLAELARLLGCGLEGSGAIEVTRVAGIEDAGPGDVTFLSNAKYASKVATTRASAIIAGQELTSAPCAVLRTSEVYLTFARAVGVLTPPAPQQPGISPLASIHPTADLGPDVSIGAFVVVGAGARVGGRAVLHPHVTVEDGATVGADACLHAHVSVREGCSIGARVILQNGVVIGSDGFGFAPRSDGSLEKIPQVGRVVVEDDVEIGANATVDRPAVGETRIGRGAKIDNLVQVGHGVKIGKHVLLAAQVGIAGSTVIEDHVIMGGQVGVAGHVRIGRGAKVGAKAGVTKDVGTGEHVAGVPAADIAEWREATVLQRRLPELRRRIAELEARLAALESTVKPTPPRSRSSNRA